MAQAPSAETVAIADGSTRQFSFEFFYLETADVFVTVDGVAVEFEWLTSNTLLLAEVPEAGSTVRMYRSTPAARPKYEFQLGAPFLPRYIDENFTQGLYVLQEGLGDIRKTELRMDSVEDRMDSVEDQVANFEIESGYEFLGEHADGPWTLERYNQVVRREGEWYRIGRNATLPYTTQLDWELDAPNLIGVGDAALRQDLANPDMGAAMVARAVVYAGSVEEVESMTLPVDTAVFLTEEGRAGEFVVKNGTPPSDPQKGIYIILANGNYAERVEKQNLNVGHFGALYAGDESVIAQAMVSLINELRVPPGRTLTAKNIELDNNTVVDIAGSIAMPAGAVDFDKILYAYNKSDISVFVNDLDGNFANQGGTLGTHLVYFIDCVRPNIHIKYAHDHYYVSGGSIGNTDGGNRDSSSGAIYLLRPISGEIKVLLLENWGREGVQIRGGKDCDIFVGHCQGTDTGNQYSGVQVAGTGHRLLRASVDKSKASAIGFDTVDGIASNLIATNSLELGGINFGHPGAPASGSVASNIVVDRVLTRGIQVSAATENLSISNFSIKNAGVYGIGVSDSSKNVRLSNGFIGNSGVANVFSFGADTVVNLSNVDIDSLDARSLDVTVTSGSFVDGESIVASGGVTGTIRAVVLSSVNGAVLLLSTATGAIGAGETITGVSSGATATVGISRVPVKTLLSGGGLAYYDETFFPGEPGPTITKFPNGTAIYKFGLVAAATADTNEVFTAAFPSQIVWDGAPAVQATISSGSATSNYTVERLEASASTSQIDVRLRTSFTQTYGIALFAIGKYLR